MVGLELLGYLKLIFNILAGNFMIIFLLYIILGFIFNFTGSLAKHLKNEDKYRLKENKNRNWFNKYPLIIAIRTAMIFIYPLFFFSYYILKRKPIEPISFLDKLDESVVKRFRKIGTFNYTAPTEKCTDEKIIEIYTLICKSFRKASFERHERIPANNLNTIAMTFFKTYEEFGDAFMKEHLEYELKNYEAKGLRIEFKTPLSLF